MEGNKTAEKIEVLKKRLEELHNKQSPETTDVDRLLEYWDKEDTITDQIKYLSIALSSEMDIVALQGIKETNHEEYIKKIAIVFGADIK